MNVLGRIFLNFLKDRQKVVKTERPIFFVRWRKTYVLNNFQVNRQMENIIQYVLKILEGVFYGTYCIILKNMILIHLLNYIFFNLFSCKTWVLVCSSCLLQNFHNFKIFFLKFLFRVNIIRYFNMIFWLKTIKIDNLT